jgi:formylglycine-generating enzyme required for sulfatase activity
MGGPDGEDRQDLDERPRHRVTLTRGFWLGPHQVTQAQWEAVMDEPAPGRFRGPDRPTDGVSWDDCQRFLEKLGAGYRLPTEAEWEYACRGLTTTPFSFGTAVSSGLANFDGNYPYGPIAVGPWLEVTTPVGSYPPNAWGLHDMHGNVWEWCNDWYDEEYYSACPEADPPGPEDGTMKVLRGGSWYSYSWSCRSAGRERFSPESGAGNYGLRVAATA